MTQEEKQLLLKDLCARIPYRTFVCLNPGAYNKPETCILTGGSWQFVGKPHASVNISACALGKRKTAYRYNWQYV